MTVAATVDIRPSSGRIRSGSLQPLIDRSPGDTRQQWEPLPIAEPACTAIGDWWHLARDAGSRYAVRRSSNGLATPPAASHLPTKASHVAKGFTQTGFRMRFQRPNLTRRCLPPIPRPSIWKYSLLGPKRKAIRELCVARPAPRHLARIFGVSSAPGNAPTADIVHEKGGRILVNPL